jgi:hypothetical protein
MSKATFPSDDELIEIGTKVHDILPDDKKLCRYGVGWKDGSVEDLKTYWCHAALMRAKGLGNTKKGGPVVISNRIMYKYRPSLSKMIDEYSSFLVNDSVFSECFVNKDMSRLGTQGLIVRTDKPPNMVAAACIASRQAWEHSWVASTTLLLIKEGVLPRVAEIVSYLAKVTEGGEINQYYTSGHSPMRLSSANKQVIRSILSGKLNPKVELNKGTWQEALAYGGIGEMWEGYKEGDFGGSCCIRFESDRDTELSDPFNLLKYVEKKEKKSIADVVMEKFEEFL